MRRMFILLTVFLLPASVLGQKTPEVPAGQEEIIKQTERYFDATDRQDTKTLDALLLDDCMAFYPRGVTKTKAAMLKELGKTKSGGEKEPATHSTADLKVRRAGNTAVVTCQLTTNQGNTPGITHKRTLIWTRQDNRWRLLHDQWSFVGAAREAEFWSDYFRGDNRNYNRKPNALLAEAIQGRRPGKALDVGMGSGRNAHCLARHGWDVTGIDRSDGALAVARQQAIDQGLRITPVLQSAEQFDWGHGRWDLIALLYFHGVRENMPKIRQSLRPGGLVFVEAFQAQPGKPSGGVFYEPNELRNLFAGFEILKYEEVEAVADYGQKQQQLVRLVARKPTGHSSHGQSPRRRTAPLFRGLRARSR
ncbi:MAG: DUF4440 domain-containing protein [Pirellulales bacterium]|nr:DUF4440 domain-containing protein [Pirellulales bacterium]